MGVKFRIISLPSHLAIVYGRLLKVVPAANLSDLNLLHLCAQRWVKTNQRNVKYRKDHKEKLNAAQRDYYHTEHGKAKQKEWLENNREKRREYQRERRRKKKLEKQLA